MEKNKIVIIKIGTSTLTRRTSDGHIELNAESFKRIATQVTQLRKDGVSVLLVSSAAITAGIAAVGIKERPNNQDETMPTLQALASVGWRHVLNAWSDALESNAVGELLITKNELGRNEERSELLRVTQALLHQGIVPIVNENDAITHDEIAFGDNDTLAARLAVKIKRSHLFSNEVSLIILSDVDGVYENVKDSSSLIREINNVDAYAHVVTGSVSDGGTGGMQTKFTAAGIACRYGVDVYISNGQARDVLRKTLSNDLGTRFVSRASEQ